LLGEETSSERIKGFDDIRKKEFEDITRILEDYFTKMSFWRYGKTGKVKYKSKPEEDYRIGVHNVTFDVPEAISLAVKTVFPKTRAFLIPPGYPGAKSGKFPTVRIVSQSGAEIYIVLAGFERKSAGKQFTPQKFKIEERPYQYNDLYKYLTTKIRAMDLNNNIENYLLFLLDSVVSGNITKTLNSIIISKKDYDDSSILPIDRTNIQSDFGEILSAIAMARKNNEKISFPESSTEPLIDFEVGNIKYSVKSLSGAAATLTSMIKYYDYVKDEMDIPQKEKNILLKIFNAIEGKIGVEQTYLAITKLVDKNAWSAMLELLEIDDLIIDDSKIALKIIKEKLDYYYHNKTLDEKLKKFYSAIGRVRSTPTDKYDPAGKYRHGYVIYPLASLITKIFNENKFHILDNIKEIINQIENTKQVNFDNQKDRFIFKITNLDKNVNIKFEPGGSINEPHKQNLRFKIT